MKLPLSTIKTLARALHKQLKPEELTLENGSKLQVFTLEDITMSFTKAEKPSFFGLSFTVLARDFSVLSTLELLVSLPSEDGEDEEVFEINDEKIGASLNQFLLWRATMLETNGI